MKIKSVSKKLSDFDRLALYIEPPIDDEHLAGLSQEMQKDQFFHEYKVSLETSGVLILAAPSNQKIVMDGEMGLRLNKIVEKVGETIANKKLQAKQEESAKATLKQQVLKNACDVLGVKLED